MSDIPQEVLVVGRLYEIIKNQERELATTRRALSDYLHYLKVHLEMPILDYCSVVGITNQQVSKIFSLTPPRPLDRAIVYVQVQRVLGSVSQNFL